MTNLNCHQCGSPELKTKEIELRHIHAATMQIKTIQKLLELECFGCGWVGAIERLSKPSAILAF